MLGCRRELFNFQTEPCALRVAGPLPLVLLFIIVRTDQINLPEYLCAGCMLKVILFLPNKSQTCCRLYFISLFHLRLPFATCLTNHIVSTYYQGLSLAGKCIFSFSQRDSEFSLVLFPISSPSLFNGKIANIFLRPSV